MQRKIMEINEGKWHLVCIKKDGDVNPYRLYKVWYDMGKHRKLIVKYGEWESVVAWMWDHMVRGMDY